MSRDPFLDVDEWDRELQARSTPKTNKFVTNKRKPPTKEERRTSYSPLKVGESNLSLFQRSPYGNQSLARALESSPSSRLPATPSKPSSSAVIANDEADDAFWEEAAEAAAIAELEKAMGIPRVPEARAQQPKKKVYDLFIEEEPQEDAPMEEAYDPEPEPDPVVAEEPAYDQPAEHFDPERTLLDETEESVVVPASLRTPQKLAGVKVPWWSRKKYEEHKQEMARRRQQELGIYRPESKLAEPVILPPPQESSASSPNKPPLPSFLKSPSARKPMTDAEFVQYMLGKDDSGRAPEDPRLREEFERRKRGLFK